MRVRTCECVQAHAVCALALLMAMRYPLGRPPLPLPCHSVLLPRQMAGDEVVMSA